MSPRRTALLLSLGLHLALGYAIIVLLWAEAPEPPGSEELDVELVSPHLAPPPRQNGLTERGTTRQAQQGPGHQGQLQAQLALRGQRACSASELPAFEANKQAQRVQAQRVQAQREQQAQRVQAQRVQAQREHAEQQRQPHAQGELPAAQAKRHQLQKLFTTVLPQAAAPLALAQAMRAEQQQRASQQQRALAAARQREVTVERRLAQLSAVAQGDSQRQGQAASGRALQDGSAGRHGGAPQLGLRFYLSGRQVASSRVVRPPEPISLPEIRCAISSMELTPATVRMLVDKAGEVGVAYLRRSSRSAHFDRCAVKHAKAIRFKPGTDKSGTPLNVWIHVRVEPSSVGLAGS